MRKLSIVWSTDEDICKSEDNLKSFQIAKSKDGNFEVHQNYQTLEKGNVRQA